MTKISLWFAKGCRSTTALLLVLGFTQCKPASADHKVINQTDNGQKNSSLNSQPEPGKAPVSAKCLHIVNGEATDGFAASVFLIHDNLSEFCTGVFVGPNTLLTAAHCIDKSTPTDIAYVVGVTALDLSKSKTEQLADRIRPLKVVTLEDAPIGAVGPYPLAALAQTVRKDLAVLIFENNVAPAISPLLTTRPKAGSLVTLVGYGSSRTDDDSKEIRKRMGTNKTSMLPAIAQLPWDGHIALMGPANPDGTTSGVSRADHGDSGGPLFAGSSVYGIFSHIYYADDIRPQNGPLADFLNQRALSSYADVTDSDALILFNNAKAQGAMFTEPIKEPSNVTTVTEPKTTVDTTKPAVVSNCPS